MFKIKVKNSTGPIFAYHFVLKSVYAPIDKNLLKTGFSLSLKLQLTIKINKAVLKKLKQNTKSMIMELSMDSVGNSSLVTISQTS